MKRLTLILLAVITLVCPAWANSDSLDTLFERLKAAPTPAAADITANAIKQAWAHVATETDTLLMERSDLALEHEDYPLAIELLDRLIVLDPDWAEAWNRRATVFYLMDDDRRSMADIAETLKREPRHFGAITGMGLIFLRQGNKKQAFDAFLRVLDIYPQLETAQHAVEQLRPEVEGEPL